MEYLEGETLARPARARARCRSSRRCAYGVEIADALDKAHRQGIVHRDLKPGNVMLTKSGVEAARLRPGQGDGAGGAAVRADVAADGPAPRTSTQEGTILGTFQYMAPEQLEGKDADARTDIFAFGAVLYEMATGTQGVRRARARPR